MTRDAIAEGAVHVAGAMMIAETIGEVAMVVAGAIAVAGARMIVGMIASRISGVMAAMIAGMISTIPRAVIGSRKAVVGRLRQTMRFLFDQ